MPAKSCPKCKSKIGLYGVSTTLSAASLERQRDDFAFVSGTTCAICGHWIDDPLSQVKPTPVRPKNGPAPLPEIPKSVNTEDYRYQARMMVEKYFDSITRMRTAGDSWNTICKLMSASAMSKVGEKTVIKYYAAECQKLQGELR